ncbi:MAG TPA: hypothetical protein ENK18_23030, partial [Deltaproteobacteria bacterium]|nr:hypothetical protein [Deltaproteobacteria bacterium]
EVGDKSIGLVGVTLGSVEGCEVGDPRAALEAGAAALQGSVDVILGLIPASSDQELSRLIGSDPLPLQLAVDARGKLPVAGADRRGGALFVGAGSRGKALGVMRLGLESPRSPWVVEGMKDKLEERRARMQDRRATAEESAARASDEAVRKRFEGQIASYDKQIQKLEAAIASAGTARGNTLRLEQIQLDRTIRDHAATQELVDAAKEAITTSGGSDPRRFVPRIVEAGPYAGGAACVACHKEEHSQWSRTGHARAWNALVAEERALDNECWSCHVTGAGQRGGPTAPASAGGFRDVQCEACHGPGRAHVAAPEQSKPVRDPAIEVCTRCHDGERDGGRFDPAAYRAKVVHTPGAEAGEP